MFSVQYLKEKFSNEGINCFSVFGEGITSTEPIFLETNTIEELITFVKVNNLKSVFFTYDYYDKDDYLINEELFNDEYGYKYRQEEEEDDDDDEGDEHNFKYNYNKEIYTMISEDVDIYNKRMEEEDFSKPNALCIFSLYEGHLISIFEADDWCKTLGIVTAKEKLHELIENYRFIIDSKQEEMRLKEEKLEEELRTKNEKLKIEFKQYILNDEEFKKCTNQKLRKEYIETVFYRDETKKYKPAFFYEGKYFNRTNATNFVELLWKEYKIHK